MNILVTGGAGYIGSHACKALALAGYTPISFDNLVYGHEWAVRWGPSEQGDIIDRTRLDYIFNHYRPEAVMHFAAYAYVGESVYDPGKYYSNNVAGTLTLIESMLDHGVKNLVFSSSCATYGIPESWPIQETQQQMPINPYGASKMMIERILKDFDHAHGLRSISLRYFNAAGADPDCLIGEAHYPETHLIPLIFDAVSGLKKAITIHGNDYNTPDGTCIRDYIHVSDIANAHVLSMKSLKEGSPSETYNLGNGKGFSVLEVIQAVERVVNKKVPYEIGPRRIGDPEVLVGDSRKATENLNWRPIYGDIDKIIETAWRWYNSEQRKSGINI